MSDSGNDSVDCRKSGISSDLCIDKAVGVADRLWVQFSLHGESLETEGCLFHHATLLAESHRLLRQLELTVQEHLLLFVFDHETGLGDRGTVIASAARSPTNQVLLLVALLISCLGVRLAIEDHLLPRLKPLEDVEHILIHRVVYL